MRVLPAGEAWQVVGGTASPGVVPQGLTLSVNQSGPDTASFTLARSARLPWRDLLPYTPVDIEVEGCGLVWGGRIQSATPTDQGWTVTCRGWQYSLDDDLTKRLFVHQRLADWQDMRNWPACDLTGYGGALAMSTGGVVQWQVPTGQVVPAVGAQGRSGVYLDGGASGAISRVIVGWQASNNTPSMDTWLTWHDTDPTSTANGVQIATWQAGASGTFSYTLPSPSRFIGVQSHTVSGAAWTATVTSWMRAVSIMAAASTTYESGGKSALRASHVVAAAAALCPLLSTDTSLIQTSGLIDAGTAGIPHLTTEGGYETPRQLMARANSYHDWLMGVAADRRVYFGPRPTAPVGVMGGWSGSAFADAGDQGDELYNRAIVNFTGPDGIPTQVIRTAASPLLNLGGATRAKILDTQATLTQGAAQTLGDAWLARRTARPARGSVTIQGTGALRTPQGGDVTPAETLRWPGQLLRLADRWDPDTGGLGRDAAITAVTWSQESDTATLTLDAPTDRLEVVLGRFAALQAARPANY